MEEFNLSKINIYSIDELVEYILSGSTTKEQLYKNGLFRPNRPLLEKALEVREEDDWHNAETAGTPNAISDYLKQYDKEEPYYRGKHVDEAKEIYRTPINEDEEPVEIDETISISEIENEDNKAELSNLLSLLIINSQKRELAQSDNEAWLKATSKNTIHSYEEYLCLYKNNPWGYVGKHIEDAKQKILQLQEVSDWHQTIVAKTKTAYDKYISKYEPIKHLLTSNHIDNAKKWLKSQYPTQLSKSVKSAVNFVVLCVVACLCVWVYKYFTKSDVPTPLSQDEIAEIIKEKQDSLKIDLFDGFYLTPAIIGQSDREMAICSDIDSDRNSSTLEPSGPTSKEEVLANYVSTLNGKFNIANKDGVILDIPEAENGIDSVCLKNAPFLEYIDNYGLRRVVVLLKDDVYFYLGECGSHDGFRQYILANKNGKYGLVDENGTILKDFFNERITLASKGYYVKNGRTNQFYNFAGNAIDNTATLSKSTDNSNIINVERNYGKKDFFKDNSGRIIASFDDISYSYESGYYKVKGSNGKYGIYNTSNRNLTVPTIYDEISIYGYKTNLFPAKKDGKWGYVKSGGSVVIPFKFNEAYSFGTDSKLAAVKDENGKCGYIDMDGNFKIPAQYYSGGTMSSDGARVMKSSSEYGYINKSGNLIASWYPYMSQKFVLDRIFVRNSNQLGGFVNRQNRLVIPYMFDAKTESTFNEDSHLAKVSYNGIEWYINTNGAFCYPASSNLKPSEQNIQTQIVAARENAEREKAERENRKKNNNDRKSR